MIFLDPYSESSFEVIGSNTSLVANFGSTTGTAYTRYFGQDPFSNVGYAIGSSNTGPNRDPLFIIGEISDDSIQVSPNIIVRNGNVGIGTLAPTSKLTVHGNATITGTLTASNLVILGASSSLTSPIFTDQLLVENTGNDVAAIIRQQGTNSIAEFYKDQILALKIAENGNVGVGLSTPSAQLEVAKDTRLNSLKTSFITGDGSISSDGSIITNGGVRVGGSLTSTGLEVVKNATITLTQGTAIQSVSYSHNVSHFKVDADGYVGIGTHTPSHKLHVYSSNATEAGYEQSGIMLENAGNGETGIALRTGTMGQNTWVIGINSNQTRLDIAYSQPTSQVDDSTVSMSILENGNVGIGTKQPLYKLHVTDLLVGIDANRLIIDNPNVTNTRISGKLNGNLLLNSRASADNEGTVFANNGVQSVIINQFGNLGIGTSIPFHKLHVTDNTLIGKGAGASASATTVQGGPFFKQGGWVNSVPSTTHNILYPSYCIGDNTGGTIHIQVSNKINTASSKIGNLTLSFIKRATQPVDIFLISTHTSSTLDRCSVAASGSDIVVTTDNDCYVSWTSIGSF